MSNTTNENTSVMLTALDELAFRRAQADAMGGEEAVAKQHSAKRLTIRERIERLVDEDSFKEWGKLAGSGVYDAANKLQAVTPAPYVAGTARILGRRVALGGEDFTVRGGTTFSATRRKGGQGGLIEDIAKHYSIPLVNLIDGAGGSVTSIERRGYSVFPGVHGFETSVDLLGRVPVASAVLGTAAGGPEGRAMLSHFSVMVDNTSHLFAAGPPVVKRSLNEDSSTSVLGGADTAVDKAGSVHNRAVDEDDAFRQIVRFLEYMPQNVWEMPPRGSAADTGSLVPELRSIVPERRTQAYNMRTLIGHLVDPDSTFEIQPTHGRSVITALARVNGYPLGVVANNPMVLGGAMDAASSEKQVHFMELCDLFHIPLLFLVDVPGFMVGIKAEEEGTIKKGMRVVHSAATLRVPTLTMVIRKCYGMAGMATTNKNGADIKVAWPTGEWGSLPIEGGVAAAFKREIAEAEDPAVREKEIEDRLRPYASPFRTAEAFAVEDVIDPAESRSVVGDFIDMAQTPLKTQLCQRSVAPVAP